MTRAASSSFPVPAAALADATATEPIVCTEGALSARQRPA